MQKVSIPLIESLVLNSYSSSQNGDTSHHLPKELVQGAYLTFSIDNRVACPLGQEIPLFERRKGKAVPVARIVIDDYTHRMNENKQVMTSGHYRVRSIA